MKNMEIRQAISAKRIRHYEVAQVMRISPYTLSVWLRTDLPPDKKEKVLEAITKVRHADV